MTFIISAAGPVSSNVGDGSGVPTTLEHLAMTTGVISTKSEELVTIRVVTNYMSKFTGMKRATDHFSVFE